MSQPLYFDADPGIDDSDQLGYGNLIFDDGHQEWLNGDAELAATLPPPPAPSNDQAPASGTQPADMTGVQDPQTGELMQPGQPYTPDLPSMNDVAGALSIPDVPHALGLAPDPKAEAGAGAKMPDSVPIPGTNHTIDPSTGDITTNGAASGQQPSADGGSGSAQMPGSVPIPGTNHTIDPSTGNITPGGAAQQGLGTGGLQVAQREGALPPGMAAQQRNELASGDQQVYDATQQARDNELKITREAALKRQGELDAEKLSRDAQLRQDQANETRLQSERQDLAKMDIKTDLVSAEGPIGAIFSIVGAALLGAVHSDAGLRMIDSTIDGYVKKQVNMRDTKLGLLAQDLGSTQQAIAAGKAALYKIVAEKAQVTADLSKADVFEAQTPQILAQLQQRQNDEERKFDVTSMGKITEKPAAPNEKAMTAYQQAKLQQGYGKAAASQDEATKNAFRALDAVGGKWDPKTQTITNKAELLKEGIPGVGKVDTFMQGVPGLRNIDNAVTSDKGLAVRAALADLVAAKAIEQNPGRAPTEGDSERASQSLGLGTEQGTLNAIERVLRAQGEHKAENVASFGQKAADSYQGQLQQSGGTPQTTQGAPLDLRPAQPGQARQQLQQDRQQKQQPDAQLSPQQKMQEVAGAVQSAAGQELSPEGLKILAAQSAHETRNGEAAPNNNMFGRKAVGKEKAETFTTPEGEGSNAHTERQSFKAYDSIQQSVEDQVSLLKRKYPDAWHALQVGDVDGYVAALKDGGYFTGNETLYLNSVKSRL